MPRYRKLSGKHYRREGKGLKCYLPGDIIECSEYEIRNFLDTFELVSEKQPAENTAKEEPEVESETKDGPIVENVPVLRIEHKGRGKYNVVTASGSAVNDRPLTKDEAWSLIRDATEPVEEKAE